MRLIRSNQAYEIVHAFWIKKWPQWFSHILCTCKLIVNFEIFYRTVSKIYERKRNQCKSSTCHRHEHLPIHPIFAKYKVYHVLLQPSLLKLRTQFFDAPRLHTSHWSKKMSSSQGKTRLFKDAVYAMYDSYNSIFRQYLHTVFTYISHNREICD